MSQFAKHLEVLAEKKSDQLSVQESAKALKKDFNALQKSNHLDELRKLRASTEAQLQRKDLDAEARNALDDLRAKLVENAIEEPLLDPKLGEKVANTLPDSLKVAKEPLRKGVDGLNEGAQRGFELSKKGVSLAYGKGKELWDKSGPLGKIAVLAVAAGGVYVAFKVVQWALRKIGQGLKWLWKNKWKILTLGAVGAVGYHWGKDHGRKEILNQPKHA